MLFEEEILKAIIYLLSITVLNITFLTVLKMFIAFYFSLIKFLLVYRK